MKSELELKNAGEMVITLAGECNLTAAVGQVVLADGTVLSPLAGPGAEHHRDESETPCGHVQRLHLTGGGQNEIAVGMVWSLYRDQPVLEIEMTVTNQTNRDVLLDRLVFLRGFPPQRAINREFLRLPFCRYLDQPFHWPAHFEWRNHLQEVPPEGTVTAHWSTVIGEPGKAALAIGIGAAACGGAEITFRGGHGIVGLEISSPLRTDRKRERFFRLAAEAHYTAHRMVLILGPDALTALDRYTQFVCRRLHWQLRFPPYAGLFAAYGNDSSNSDPTKVSLSEDRLATLMKVVEQHLRPYGLNTIKTQFHGYSSSRPDGKPVKKLTAVEARDPAAVKKLVADIRDQAFAPDDYDSRKDFPHGLGWHVRRLAEQGYVPALVCRPFYNIAAGTTELDRAVADLFEMAVKEWGYRYLMLDFISADYESGHDTLTVEQGIFNRFQAIRDRVGPDIFIEACMVWPGPVLGLADGYRPAHDWRGGLEEDLAPTFACRYHYHGRFFQCDNEFFDPARQPFTWGSSGVENMIATQDRVRLWVSYNAMLGYSYLAGAALERVEPDRWWIFQRGLPVQGGRATPMDFFQASPPQRWLRHCQTVAGEYHLLGLFNWSKTQPLDTPVMPDAWGLSETTSYLFFDFWTGQVYGPAQELPGWIAPFSCRMLHVQPVPAQPALVGNSRHVTGQVGIERWQWSPDTGTLQGTFSGMPGSKEQYWIWLPGNEGVSAHHGAELEFIRPHLIRLTIHFDASGRQDWQLALDRKIPVP